MFENKTLLITGGTGSFGNAVLENYIDSDLKEIRIFSRDEKKQDDLRKKYNNSKIKFYLGDIRDKKSIEYAIGNVDFIFHAAALKQVPSCEFYPIEAIKTNILGTENLLNSAIKNKVKKVICLSTDKAVYPINAMGMSKALMEKTMIFFSRMSMNTDTTICGTRYGNVMASRGSVIPLFLEQIKRNKALTITNPDMSRFLMSLKDAVNLVNYTFENGNNGDIFVQKSPSCTVGNLVKAILKIKNLENYPCEIIGTRNGEKLYESLLTSEEMSFCEDLGDYFRIPPQNENLDYSKFFENGNSKHTTSLINNEYNSHSGKLLDVSEIINLLHKLNIKNLA
tara:strand:+ start:167 stop:1180 length:1014 start_codon:yes stop_codon:yes gene_type:complete